MEAVLTGRNLLSPTLTAAARDVESFDAKVSAANARASESSAASAKAQESSAAKVSAASARTAEASSASSSKVVAANARAAESARAFADISESSAARAGVAWGAIATKGLPIAAAAFAVVTGKMAGDYQQLITKLETTAGELPKNLHMVSQGLLDMAGQVGIGADELAKGMYTVESAGYHGRDALLIEKAAAQGARQELADLPKVTDAVTTALHDYNLKGADATRVTSMMVEAVSHGKTTFDELTGSLHSITPLAAALHIPLSDILGDVAAMTASGESADQSTQNLADALRHLQNPTSIMTAELAQLGITSSDLATDLSSKGLSGTVQEISDAILHHLDPATQKVLLPAFNESRNAAQDLNIMLGHMPPTLAKLSQGLMDGKTSIGDYRKEVRGLGGQAGVLGMNFLSLYQNSQGFNNILKAGGPAAQVYSAALAKAMGDSAGLTVALQLTGDHAAAVNQSIKDISKSTGDASGNIKGWSDVQGNFNQKLAEAGAGAKSLAIEAGQHLLPALTGALGYVNRDVIPGIEHMGSVVGDAAHLFGQLPAPVRDTVLALAGLKIAMKLNFLGVSSAVTGVKASFAGLREEMALQQALWAAEQRSAMTTAAAYGEVEVALGGLIAAEEAQTVRLGTMNAAASTLAARGMAGVAKAGSSLFSLIGGPWGVALIAGITLWSQYSSGVDEVKAAMASAKTTGQELFNTYVKLGTIYGSQADAARQAVINQQGWAQAALKNGVSQATLTAALRGNAKAQSEVETAAEAASVKQSALSGVMGNMGIGIDTLSGKFKENGNAARQFFNNMGVNTSAAELFMSSIDDTKGALEDYQTAAQRIFGDGSIANRGVDTLTKGMDELAKSTGSAESSLQGITDILAGLTGAGVSAAQAAVDVTTTTIDTSNAFAQMSKGALDAKGNIDLSSAAGVGLWNSLKDVSDGFKTAVNDSYAAAGGINNAGAASAAAGKTAQTLYEKFILTATGAGMSQTAAEQLAKQLGLVPGDVVTKFTQPGMTESQGAADLLKQKVLDIPDTHTVHTSALTAEATQELQALGFTVKTLPDGTVDVTANTTPARQAIAQLSNDYQHFAINVGIGGTFGHYAAASGAILPGYTPGRDVHRFISPTAGMALDLSGGEGIARPEVVQAMGADRFMGLNRAALSGGVDGVRRVLAFAGGGFFPGMHMTADVGISPASMAAAEQAIKGMFSFGGGGSGGLRPLGRMIADNMGVGSQFGAIDYIFTRESGWNPLAQNPTSTAFGIPQFLASTWAAYGGRTTDPTMQIRDGILYMENRYGSPNAAAAFWAAHHWYDQGGILPPGLSLAMNGTGSSEHAAVFTNRQWDALQGVAAAAMPGYGATVAGGSGGPLAMPPITVQARVFVGNREITDIVRVEANAVVDARNIRDGLNLRSAR